MTIHHDFPLSEILWYKTGGTAKHLLIAESREDVFHCLEFIEKNHPERLFICGLGSNLIFPDEYFNGAVLQIATNEETPQSTKVDKEEMVEVFAGEVLDRLITFSFDNNLTGLEWAGGLPGTVGAGVRGNVGAFGGEIKDSFVNAEMLELRGSGGFDVVHKKYDDFHFSYRNSVIKENKNLLVLSTVFKLKQSPESEIANAREKYEAHIQYRQTHHPMEYPSCGSVFKNISGQKEVEKVLTVWPDIQELVATKWYGKVSMGYINKRLGFSGYRVGNMEVSTKHSNFIVNRGEGRTKDVLAIISHIQDRVSDTFGFVPEVEVEVVK